MLLLAVLATGLVLAAAAPAGVPSDPVTPQELTRTLGGLPLLFVADQVAPDGATGFVVRGSQTSVWLTDRGMSYRFRLPGEPTAQAPTSSWGVALDFLGATPRQPVGEDLLPTKVSYFKGPKEQWRTGLASYGSVRYRELWPGVDLVVSGTAGALKSTFVVRPGADPSQIRLAYRGATAVRLADDGSLVVDTPLGEVRENAPIAYQEVDGRRVKVATAFELEEASDASRHAYRFRLGGYDRARELAVDPVTLVYCGYIGGSDREFGFAVAVDGAGNAHVSGETLSTEATFPVTVGPDLTYNDGSGWDAFVARINAPGSALDYCGYIGGSSTDDGWGIAVDASGRAFVSGASGSTEATFPVTLGPDVTFNGFFDAFVARVTGFVFGDGFESGDTTAWSATVP